MGARQTFFGALAFRDAASLDAAIEEVLGPSVMGPVPPPVAEQVRAGRRDRVLFASTDADQPSSFWHPLVGAYHELSARALRGHLTMLYRGDGSELSVAVAAGPDSLPLPSASVTQRYLALDEPVVRATHLADGSPVEFEVVTRTDGTRAIDARDWLGYLGMLFEQGEALHFEVGGKVFEWARPDQPGSCRLIALPTSDLIVLVEVVGPRTLAVGGIGREAIEITLHQLAASTSEHDYRAGWRDRAHRRSTVWVAPAAGLVAFG